MADSRFDRDKFRELIIYIADRCSNDPLFGDTRLNKVLFFSDAFALKSLGAPIVGARYQKLGNGPVAKALLPVRREMEAEGSVEIRKIGQPARTVTVPLRQPDLTRFSTKELKLVDEVICLFEGHTAATVSHFSHHNSPGWSLVDSGDDIPLESQLLSSEQHSQDVLRRGRELSTRFSW